MLAPLQCHSSAETIAKALTGNYRVRASVCARAGTRPLRRLPREGICLRRPDRSRIEGTEHPSRSWSWGSSAARGVGIEPIRRTLWLSTFARRCSRCSERTSPVINGLGAYLSLKLIAECGDDLSSWPSAKHFTSWLGLAPSNKVSGGKMLSSRTRRSGGRAAALLRLAAVTVGRTDTALGAFYRRLSARIGKAKAVTATARKIAVLFYNAVRSWNGICRSRSVVVRDTLPHASGQQSASACQGIRLCSPAHGAKSWCCRFLGIVLQRQLADLGVQRLHVDRRLRGAVAAARTEHIGSPALEAAPSTM